MRTSRLVTLGLNNGALKVRNSKAIFVTHELSRRHSVQMRMPNRAGLASSRKQLLRREDARRWRNGSARPKAKLRGTLAGSNHNNPLPPDAGKWLPVGTSYFFGMLTSEVLLAVSGDNKIGAIIGLRVMRLRGRAVKLPVRDEARQITGASQSCRIC